jgi:hypothetical protein
MDDQGYELVKKIITRAVEEYDPFERVRVRCPLDGIVTFSDGASYKFVNGVAEVRRKHLQEAYEMGCRRLGNGPRSPQEP